MKKINIKGVSVQTWARTAVLLLALISQLCVILGKEKRSDRRRSMAGIRNVYPDGYRLRLVMVEKQQLYGQCAKSGQNA